jgi:hypothetical protein
MSEELKSCAKAPCVSCPYRQDVPSGIWHPEEYIKLLQYDGETWAQSTKLFDCHQKDGHLCAGWVATHGNHLLALRLHANEVDPAVFDYSTSVPVFASGREAAIHGIQDIENPGPEAKAMMARLLRKREETDDADHY